MPYLSDNPSLPFSGTTPIAKHCSAQGAQKALPSAGSQALKVLLLIKAHTLLTDHEIVDLSGLPKGLIVACGSKIGPFWVSNALWAIA